MNSPNLLITDPTNIRYLTGFAGVSPDEREAFVLKTTSVTYLFTNSLYIEAASRLAKPNLTLIEISRENPMSKELAKLCKKLGIDKVGFEDTNLTVAEFTRLKNALRDVTLVPVQHSVENLRRIKRNDELEHIRNACSLTDSCFEYILNILKPGVTESEIALAIETFFRKHRAENAFSPIVAFGANSSMPHYISGNSTLRKNDLVLLDFGARINGYCADMTRTVFTGTPKNEWIAAYTAVSHAQALALDTLTATKSGARCDRAARESLIKDGFPPYPHSLGHALGLDIHESPRLSYKKDVLLKPNMVITVEPGIYIPEKFGIRIEDTVLVTKDGIELFTTSKKDIIRI